MNEEQVLSALSDLTNGALNYYRATQTVMVRDNLIRNYIELLQKQNTELKEENFKLQARSDRVINNWNKLKEWLEEYIETNEKWYSSELSNHDKEYYKKDYIDSKFWLMKFQKQMQEIEGGMNE